MLDLSNPRTCAFGLQEVEMSFLLRCLFWLGLVVSQIAEREGASLANLTQPAGRELAAGAEQMTQRAVDAAAAACRDNAASCLALAAQAAQLRLPEAATAPSRPAPAEPIGRDTLNGRDTLSDADRAPAWRLRRANAGA
ncbi:hypothetical protein CH337_21200 [Rhodoblastus acidophilus]|nr:hypothetical protein CKO16_21675 [Rhodoblastus acidophilus]RAI16465.1 hypothetical protein CH337_21200 [Rhodoblastus acidophilus]